jgi:adenylate kinase family enzyme
MKRILVLGSGGAGKSTLATRLGELLELEVIHLDSYFWKPGWIETPKEEWEKVIESLTKGNSWIIDGNFSGTLEQRLRECDTIIFLDRPRWVCLWRVLKRWIMYRNRSRPDMAVGCEEKLDMEFLHWIWTYPKRSKPKIARMLSDSSTTKKIIWIKSQKEEEEFLSSMGAANFALGPRTSAF